MPLRLAAICGCVYPLPSVALAIPNPIPDALTFAQSTVALETSMPNSGMVTSRSRSGLGLGSSGLRLGRSYLVAVLGRSTTGPRACDNGRVGAGGGDGASEGAGPVE